MVECGFSRRGIAIIQSYLMAALVIVYNILYAYESFVFDGETATLRAVLPDCRLLMRRPE
jgi:hypothetical protein